MRSKIFSIIKSALVLMIIATFMNGSGIKANINPFELPITSIENTDSDILSIAIAADQIEMDAAQIAQKKNINSQIIEYANMLYTDHSDNMIKANELLSTLGLSLSDSKEILDLKQRGSDGIARLRALDGSAFEFAFIGAMIKGHNEVLEMIDTKLNDETTSQSVKSFLTETRDKVSMHLDEAIKLMK